MLALRAASLVQKNCKVLRSLSWNPLPGSGTDHWDAICSDFDPDMAPVLITPPSAAATAAWSLSDLIVSDEVILDPIPIIGGRPVIFRQSRAEGDSDGLTVFGLLLEASSKDDTGLKSLPSSICMGGQR
jgi:hypothetical protein